MSRAPYFGGKGATLEEFKKMRTTLNIDGTTYKIEDWLQECAAIDKLEPGKTPVYVPYGGAEEYGVLVRVEWDKREYDNGWWVYEPVLIVLLNDINWYVYEYTFYKNWRRKTQRKHLRIVKQRPKGKFLSKKDIAELKRNEAIENSKKKLQKK